MTKEEVLKEFRVKEILSAARKVIGRYGYEGTTIDRVAEDAEVAKGTIYLYFANKDVLLHRAIIEGLREFNADLKRTDASGTSPVERLTGLVRAMFQIQSSNEDFVKALILDSRFVSYEPGDPRGDELREVYFEMLQVLAEAIRPLLGERAAQIDPNLAAIMLSDMAQATLKRRMLGVATGSREDEVNAVLRIFLYGVRGVCPEVVSA